MTEYDPPFYVCSIDRLHEMWMSRSYSNVIEKVEAEISFWEVIDGSTDNE